MAPFESIDNLYGYEGVTGTRAQHGRGYKAQLKLRDGTNLYGAGQGFTIPEAAMAYARAHNQEYPPDVRRNG